MIVKVVYGPPCSGKSTYVRENTGDNDLVYDYDRLIKACSNKTLHTTDKHCLHGDIISLRKTFVDLAKLNSSIETFWLICSWFTDNLKSLLDGLETEEIFMDTPKEECYERLEKDEMRIDKDEWRKIIDEWFEKYSAKSEVNIMKNKFWNWIKNEGGRELRLEGVIADSTWYGDEVTPKLFREELINVNSLEYDDITVWINSYGGDCFAASQIYTMLKEYPCKVTVKIDGIAASAASVIAMAGDKVLMSPTSVIMIHNPATIAAGDSAEMKAAIRMLDEVKESIINAYELKTNLARDKISKMMDAETWLNAKKAVELKFADDILFAENSKGYEVEDAVIYSRAMVTNSLLDRIKTKKKSVRLDAAQFYKRLNLIR